MSYITKGRNLPNDTTCLQIGHNKNDILMGLPGMDEVCVLTPEEARAVAQALIELADILESPINN